MKNTNRIIDSFSTLFLLFLLILVLNGCAPKTIINASYDGNLTLAKELIRDGADVNTRYSGLTPLHNAAYNGHLEVAKLLIQEGADINSLTDRDGITPLANAAAQGDFDVVKLLVKNGAKVNLTAKGKTGVKPLHNAANYGHLDIAKFLIQHGADVNATTYTYGTTPLHNAAANGHIEIVQVLIENGADMNVKAIGKHKGKTPLDNARINGHKKVANLLINHGANENFSLQAKNKGNNPKSKSKKLAKEVSGDNISDSKANRLYTSLTIEPGSLDALESNKYIMELTAYLRAFPHGKNAYLYDELTKYYKAEQTMSKRAFEEYLNKWPSGKFEKWAKDNLAFINSEEDSDHLLAKMVEEADRILRDRIKQKFTQLRKTYANNLKNTGRSLEVRELGRFKQLGILDEHAVIFEGSLNATLNSTAESIIYYKGKVDVGESKFKFILKYKLVAEPYFKIVPGTFDMVPLGSAVTMNKKQYYYNGRHWIQRLIGPFFFNNISALDD